MPSVPSLTVKKANGTTDIIYDILSQSSGDGVFAKFRQDSGSLVPPLFRPQFWFRSGVIQGDKNGARFSEVTFMYPTVYTDSSTGAFVQGEVVKYRNGRWTVPQNIDSTTVTEATAQLANLLAHPTVRTAVASSTNFT